jgi:hypothetical protein
MGIAIIGHIKIKMGKKKYDGVEEYYGLCQTPGCHRVMDLTRYKGKFVCRLCITPWDVKQLKVEDFVIQSPTAYTPENVPMPGFTQHDIVAVQRALKIWSRGEKHAKRTKAYQRNSG